MPTTASTILFSIPSQHNLVKSHLKESTGLRHSTKFFESLLAIRGSLRLVSTYLKRDFSSLNHSLANTFIAVLALIPNWEQSASKEDLRLASILTVIET